MAHRRKTKKVNGLLAMVLLAIGLISSAPALSCEMPVSQSKWIAKGFSVHEVQNVRLFMAEFEARVGETTQADQVFVLSKDSLNTVLVIFSVKGCVNAMAPLSLNALKRIELGLPA